MTMQRNCFHLRRCPPPTPGPSPPWQCVLCCPTARRRAGRAGLADGAPGGLLRCTSAVGSSRDGADSLSSISWPWTELPTRFFWPSFQTKARGLSQ